MKHFAVILSVASIFFCQKSFEASSEVDYERIPFPPIPPEVEGTRRGESDGIISCFGPSKKKSVRSFATFVNL